MRKPTDDRPSPYAPYAPVNPAGAEDDGDHPERKCRIANHGQPVVFPGLLHHLSKCISGCLADQTLSNGAHRSGE